MKCPHCKQEYDIKFLYEKEKCKNCGTPANLTVGQNNDVARLYSAITDNASVPQKKNAYTRTDRNSYARQQMMKSMQSTQQSPPPAPSSAQPSFRTPVSNNKGIDDDISYSDSDISSNLETANADLYQNNVVFASDSSAPATASADFEDNEDKTVSSDPFEIDIDDDKLFSESYDSNEPDEDEEEESYYIDEEEDESDYAESDSDIIDTNTPPINSDSTHKESLSASTKEPKTKKNCSEWLHEAIEKRNAEQHEQLEYPDLNLNYNKDGFYDDTPVVDTLHVDRFDYRLILKFLLIIVAMILIVLFFIWYAD